jgi:hypothetical protein
MKRWSFLLLIFSLTIFNGCRQIARTASKEVESAIVKKEAAEQIARRARQLAGEAEEARIAHDLKRAALLKQQSEEATTQVKQLSRDVQEVGKRLTDEQEKREVEQAAREMTTLQGELMALKLKEDTAQDVERIIEEEAAPREQCLPSVEGLLKGMICFSLKTYVKETHLPSDTELANQLAKTLYQACLPAPKTPEWFKKAKAWKSLVDDVNEEPDNLTKLEIAAVDYGCSVR